ncbi:GNAT family N-acetyltransferase [Paenibacillus eucommiae]|uniref:GNAT superfamily N-acetyltransferase n=1 Tax=Paenibacillus eucommiae TaxID=1355755 RepID=A0ABS4IPJ1_9BACL|nr:GNAT family N-acetyltransferase [Paenibacillus eucommiae]MBP1988544.1 GNAT superfamily N-acetyltransferase [Paenibacillus eucommiae]
MERPQVQIKSLSECTFNETLELWNNGFQGYYSDMTQSMPGIISHLGNASIHPGLSVAAFVEGKPAGFVLTGIKEVNGIKTAWNGGTGVSPEFRGMGIAKALMKEMVHKLREEGAHIATLEVVSKNVGAIAAYESGGFESVDGLTGMRHEGAFAEVPFRRKSSTPYSYHTGKPNEVSGLSFYRDKAAWMTQWFNWNGGESILVYDSKGEAAAYVLLRRSYNDDGSVSSITISHCEANPQREDADEVVRFALARAFEPFNLSFVRATDNLSLSSTFAVEALVEAGFTQVYEQKLMMIDLA